MAGPPKGINTFDWMEGASRQQLQEWFQVLNAAVQRIERERARLDRDLARMMSLRGSLVGFADATRQGPLDPSYATPRTTIAATSRPAIASATTTVVAGSSFPIRYGMGDNSGTSNGPSSPTLPDHRSRLAAAAGLSSRAILDMELDRLSLQREVDIDWPVIEEDVEEEDEGRKEEEEGGNEDGKGKGKATVGDQLVDGRHLSASYEPPSTTQHGSRRRGASVSKQACPSATRRPP